MSLIDNIVRIRDESFVSLDASHNYYVHTSHVWRIVVQQIAQSGLTFTVRNQETGTVVDESQLSGLAQGYVTGYLASATFQHFVTVFERFVFDFITAWLIEYPESLSEKHLTFRTVLDSPDRNAIVSTVVQKEVGEFAYQRIVDWFVYLKKIAKLRCPSRSQIERLAEITASRDVLVHNKGIAEPIYIHKSMGHARYAVGDILELPQDYHRESWLLMRRVVEEMSAAAVNKLGK